MKNFLRFLKIIRTLVLSIYRKGMRHIEAASAKMYWLIPHLCHLNSQFTKSKNMPWHSCFLFCLYCVWIAEISNHRFLLCHLEFQEELNLIQQLPCVSPRHTQTRTITHECEATPSLISRWIPTNWITLLCESFYRTGWDSNGSVIEKIYLDLDCLIYAYFLAFL